MQQGNEFTRYYLTAKKDLDNISKTFGISDVQKHSDDQESVRAWVEEWSHSENNPVLFHKYDFLLTSVVVIDEYGEGFPVAWCLSNHEGFTHMCVFFEMVKRNCGILTPRWLMSDLANQFFNAWVGVMGGKPKRLFCTWHVDKACQTEL